MCYPCGDNPQIFISLSLKSSCKLFAYSLPGHLPDHPSGYDPVVDGAEDLDARHSPGRAA